jgi:hypothetical protein
MMNGEEDFIRVPFDVWLRTGQARDAWLRVAQAKKEALKSHVAELSDVGGIHTGTERVLHDLRLLTEMMSRFRMDVDRPWMSDLSFDLLADMLDAFVAFVYSLPEEQAAYYFPEPAREGSKDPKASNAAEAQP